MTIALFLLAALVILLVLRKRPPTQKMYYTAPAENSCRPHSWGRLSDIGPPAVAAKALELTKDNEFLKDSLISVASSSLICTSCGYLSGTEICLDLVEFPKAVNNFIDKEKDLV